MNQYEYTQLALRTWDPEKIREKGEEPEEYLQTGLASELGELCGVRKRDMRDGYQPRLAWIKELGDCLWYAAVYCADVAFRSSASEMLAEEIRHRFRACSHPDGEPSMWPATYPVRFGGPFWTQVLFVQIMCHEYPNRSLEFVEAVIEGLGFDLTEVRRVNIEKLADRADRGVIGGKGDDR